MLSRLRSFSITDSFYSDWDVAVGLASSTSFAVTQEQAGIIKIKIATKSKESLFI